MMTGSTIRVSNLHKRYRLDDGRELAAVDGVHLQVDPAEVVAIVGPSGSGKSSLLHLIGGIDVTDSGTIVVDDRDVTALRGAELAAHRRHVGFVFQRFNLLGALSARDNVMAPLVPFKVTFDKAARANQLLGSVGLVGRERSLPSRMSGGQQQRVAIARALVWDPPLLLADEPTGNLDTQTGAEVLDLLLNMRDQRGTTIMLATHDPGVAGRCDRIVHMTDGRLSTAQDERGTTDS
jgi:putative ABC transport system ATP-binding protein